MIEVLMNATDPMAVLLKTENRFLWLRPWLEFYDVGLLYFTLNVYSLYYSKIYSVAVLCHLS